MCMCMCTRAGWARGWRAGQRVHVHVHEGGVGTGREGGGRESCARGHARREIWARHRAACGVHLHQPVAQPEARERVRLVQRQRPRHHVIRCRADALVKHPVVEAWHVRGAPARG